jgi:hypothetical protein
MITTEIIKADSYDTMYDAITNYAQDTYNGKTGCACGCAGNYASAESVAGQSRIRRILKADFNKVVFYNFGNGEGCYDLQNSTGTRVVRVYVKRMNA